ncbi:hypothetical protein X975_15801, partial [Stegodyphus mimosarum]
MTKKKAKKCIASPAFQSFSIFDNDLVGVKMKVKTLILNRPVYAGFSILDISKTLMYQFHYYSKKMKYVKMPIFFLQILILYAMKSHVKISIMICEKICICMIRPIILQSALYTVRQIKKVIGKMKDELNGNIAIGLKSEMYSLETKFFEKKTAKGVLKPVIQRDLKHQDYRNCLFEKKLHRHNMIKIGSNKHHLSTILLRKISLSPLDDKRFLFNDGVNSLAYGHYAIGQIFLMFCYLYIANPQ